VSILFEPIGIIHTSFKEAVGVPIQGALNPNTTGEVEIFKEFQKGLKDIEGFSHLILLYYFHLVENYSLLARPFLDDIPRGVFAIRSPKRPNPIGITVVRLLERKENILKISGVDMVDETPLLDIKPYFPEVDAHNTDRTGWMGNKLKTIGGQKLADNRFR